jgi:hypothetical protein
VKLDMSRYSTLSDAQKAKLAAALQVRCVRKQSQLSFQSQACALMLHL